MSGDWTRLLERFERSAGELRRDVETLVRFESPSTDKADVDRCGAAVADLLRTAGADVSLIRQEQRGDHVRAEFAGGPRRVLLLGHFDTVWEVGTLERMPLCERDGRLHGPGVYDMKAYVAIAAHAVCLLVRA